MFSAAHVKMLLNVYASMLAVSLTSNFPCHNCVCSQQAKLVFVMLC